jgi:hypothetical protein
VPIPSQSRSYTSGTPSRWWTWDRNFGLLNCTEVRSVALPTHPTAQDDVGTTAAKAQTANAQAEGFGKLGLLGTLGQRHLVCLMVSVVPVAHDMFREVLDRFVTVPDLSETQPPAGSMHTIRSMVSTGIHSGSAMSGLRSTTLLPPMESTPDPSDSSLFRDLARDPCLTNHLCAPMLLMMLRSPIRPSSTLETRGLLLLVAVAHYGVQHQ